MLKNITSYLLAPSAVFLHGKGAYRCGGSGRVLWRGYRYGWAFGVNGLNQAKQTIEQWATQDPANFAANVAGHGLVGGLSSVAEGENFGSGFLAAGFSNAFGTSLEDGSKGAAALAYNTAVEATTGGIGSVLGGGTFEDAGAGFFIGIYTTDQISGPEYEATGNSPYGGPTFGASPSGGFYNFPAQYNFPGKVGASVGVSETCTLSESFHISC